MAILSQKGPILKRVILIKAPEYRNNHVASVFRRTWTVAEELLKEKSFFILFFVFLSEFVIRQVQTNIY